MKFRQILRVTLRKRCSRLALGPVQAGVWDRVTCGSIRSPKRTMHLDFKDLNILLQLTRQRQPVANDSWPLFCGTQQEVDVRLGRLERLGIVSLSGEGR